MKCLTLLCLGLAVVFAESKAVDSTLCKREIKCQQTEYKEYVKCLERKRVKRETCPYTNSIEPQVVQAVPIYTNVQSGCNGLSCGQMVMQPAPQIIQQQPQIVMQPAPQIMQQQPQILPTSCVNSCLTACGGSYCDDRCDRSCQPTYSRQNATTNIQRETFESAAPVAPNITTIIKLTNIINNTNVVNVPTTINNTNVNNLDLGTNTTSRQSMAPLTSKEPCCVVVQPKVCHKINSTDGGYRCIHRKHHTCGPQCQSSVVHAQVRQPCDGSPSICPPAVSYVPQPTPQCSYQPAWPYVNCGARSTTCDGCYDHYGYGFQAYHGANQPSCNGCYDDGFQTNSLYRQGPFYQPGYYHAPPVNIAPPAAMTNCNFGCFGNQYIDPVFGAASYSPYAAPIMQQPMYYPPPPVYAPPPPMYAPPAPPMNYYNPYQFGIPQPSYSFPFQYSPEQTEFESEGSYQEQWNPYYYPPIDTGSVVLNYSGSLDRNAISPPDIINSSFPIYPQMSYYAPYPMVGRVPPPVDSLLQFPSPDSRDMMRGPFAMPQPAPYPMLPGYPVPLPATYYRYPPNYPWTYPLNEENKTNTSPNLGNNSRIQ